MKHFRYTAVDDDEALDERGVLRDGYGVRVPMMLRDGMPLRVTDAAGGELGLHRPGYRVADNNAMRDAKQEAYDAYLHDLTNAWRGGCDARKVTQRDPQGRLLSTFEEEEDEMRDALPARGLTLDELQQDHQRRMSREYQAYDGWIGQQWRNP